MSEPDDTTEQRATTEGTAEPEGPAPQPTEAARRAADLDRIFGDVLPETTRDEREPGAGSRDGDDWYHRNRPPHHGG